MSMQASRIILAVTLFGASLTLAFVSRAEAATKMSGQDKFAVMEKCEADARTSNPGDEQANQSARYKSYAACMKKNGVNPGW